MVTDFEVASVLPPESTAEAMTDMAIARNKSDAGTGATTKNMADSTTDTKFLVKEYARKLGFDLVRVTSAEEFDRDRDIAIERIRAGLMDGLPWYHEARVVRGSRPQELLPGARSIICLGVNYYPAPSPPPASPSALTSEEPVPAASGQPAPVVVPVLNGKVARYARGKDYHKVMKQRMRAYVAGLSDQLDIGIAARWYVDDGPMLDRAVAARSGLGWFGKNTNILTGEFGSWVFLGQVITDLEMEPDTPLQKTCGNCVRCIDACPTGAIVAPYVIDNSRCISHLTIENRGPIPRELRPLMLDWIFGCDICQEVCPVNRKASATAEPTFGKQELAAGDLVEILGMTEEDFRERFRGTPILRAKRVGLQRNACVALGNLKNSETVPALVRALIHGEDLVRGHAAWALGEIGGEPARASLSRAAEVETSPEVLAEIREALVNLHPA